MNWESLILVIINKKKMLGIEKGCWADGRRVADRNFCRETLRKTNTVEERKTGDLGLTPF